MDGDPASLRGVTPNPNGTWARFGTGTLPTGHMRQPWVWPGPLQHRSLWPSPFVLQRKQTPPPLPGLMGAAVAVA
ncbi:hypothetical protein VTN96DRAFT_8273 [Rasamsonia emersonii]